MPTALNRFNLPARQYKPEVSPRTASDRLAKETSWVLWAVWNFLAGRSHPSFLSLHPASLDNWGGSPGFPLMW